jgi:hypothetical protein
MANFFIDFPEDQPQALKYDTPLTSKCKNVSGRDVLPRRRPWRLAREAEAMMAHKRPNLYIYAISRAALLP